MNKGVALTPVVFRSCSLRSRAARATASLGRGRVQDQSARPLGGRELETQVVGHDATSWCQVSERVSGITRTLATEVMKFVSPAKRGTT